MNETFYKKVCEQREAEIKRGKNLATRNPIYVVFHAKETLVLGHNHYEPKLSHKYPDWQEGYFDEAKDYEDRVFSKSDKRMKEPVECTKFYVDVFVTCFFTSKEAHSFIKAEKHNYSKLYVYVEYAGNRNNQIKNLFD